MNRIQHEQTEETEKQIRSILSASSCSNRRRLRLRLCREKLLERGAYLYDVNVRDLPYDVQVNIRIVMCHDVAHAAHLAEGQFGHRLPGGLAQMGRRFTDDFDAAHYGILLLDVGAETVFGGVADVAGDEAGRLQNIPQPPELVSFYRRKPRWIECAPARSDWGISPKIVAAQNPPGDLPDPPPRRPFPATRRSKPALRHRASPAGPRRCQDRCHRARPSQKSPGDGWDASRRRAATGSAILAVRAFRDLSARPEDNGIPLGRKQKQNDDETSTGAKQKITERKPQWTRP